MSIRQSILLVAFVALLFACSAPTTGTPATQPPAAITLPPAPPTSQPTTFAISVATALAASVVDKKVDVGGRELHLVCVGAGSPTVVLESGLGGPVALWSQVQPKVGAFTHVCAYDRAGLGESDSAPTPRTSQQLVEDLHTLLSNAGISGPYVLVGLSLGGMNVRLYASQYPQEVAGLVLLDSALEDFSDREAQEILPPPSVNESQALKNERQNLENNKDPSKNPENIDLEASKAQVRRIKSLGKVPLVVIVHGKPFPDVPAEIASKVEQLWQEMQRDLTLLSSESSIMTATKSGHVIAEEQPEIVIDAIRQVVDTVRRQTPR